MEMPAEIVNSSSGVLITAYGPHQFCPVIWKEKHLTGIWRSFCWDWCGKGFWKHFISIKQQREENMDYQYTQGIISWKKKISSTTTMALVQAASFHTRGRDRTWSLQGLTVLWKSLWFPSIFFPFLRGTQQNAIHFKVRHETVIFMNIRKKSVFSLSLKFSELIKNFFWHEPSLPWLYFPSPNIFCSSDTVSSVEQISQLYYKLSTCSALQVPSWSSC